MASWVNSIVMVVTRRWYIALALLAAVALGMTLTATLGFRSSPTVQSCGTVTLSAGYVSVRPSGATECFVAAFQRCEPRGLQETGGNDSSGEYSETFTVSKHVSSCAISVQYKMLDGTFAAQGTCTGIAIGGANANLTGCSRSLGQFVGIPLSSDQ